MSTDWEHLPSTGRRGQQIAYAGAGLMTLIALGSILFVLLKPFGPDEAPVQTAKGFTQMVTDAREEIGTTEVLEATVFETYAIVEVPVQGSGRRTTSYRYAGNFDDVFTKSQRDSDETAFIDLADINAGAVLALLKKAPADVGLPDGRVSSVTIRMGSVPGSLDNTTPSVFVRVDTDFDEYGSIQTDLSGKVIEIDRGDD